MERGLDRRGSGGLYPFEKTEKRKWCTAAALLFPTWGQQALLYQAYVQQTLTNTQTGALITTSVPLAMVKRAEGSVQWQKTHA